MATIDNVVDYIIIKATEAGVALNVLKLQKLTYYCQSWNLAFDMGPLFEGKFQAWVHGPVSRALYDRFKDEKSLYSMVTRDDASDGFTMDSLSATERELIDAVLNAYGGFTGDQLENLTHQEDPWVNARGTCSPTERCENEIDENVMKTFYADRLKKQ